MNTYQPDEKQFEAWQEAEALAIEGDNSKLIKLLRQLYRPYEIPDLWFLANLLEGKFSKTQGRPFKSKISAGLDQHYAAEAVSHIVAQNVSVEEAVSQVAAILPMSESSIKKHYIKLGGKKFKEKPLFKAKIDKTFK